MKKTIASLLIAGSMAATAGTPVFYFTALNDTNIFLGQDEKKIVSYKIRNQSVKAHTLALRKIVGVSQLGGTNACTENQRLEGGHTCILNLEIDGATFRGLEDRSPRVCADNSVLMCYTPSESQLLKVTLE